jgi:pimeloyl-ACP methyl ester carboxylesterase
MERFRDAITGEIMELLRIQKNPYSLDTRHIVATPRKGYIIEKVEFISEPGIYIPAWVFVPEHRKRESSALIYVHENGKEAESMEFGVLEKLTRNGFLIIAVDVRGVGATKPPHPDEEIARTFTNLDNAETTMAYWAWEINQSLFGRRVLDVLRSVDYALSRSDVDRTKVRIIGKGMGALWTLYAAALDTRIALAICDEGLLSYRFLTRSDRYRHGANIMIPNVLNSFDLPHVAGAVAGRPLAILSPVDEMKEIVPTVVAQQEFQWTSDAFAAAGATSEFRILQRNKETDDADQYHSLLNDFSG